MPIGLVRAGEGERLVLDCSIEDAAELEHAEEMAYLRLGEFPVEDPRYDVTVSEMLALPYYQGIDMPSAGLYGYEQGVEVRYQRVPKGEVEVRRASPVRSSDDHHLGHVEGLIVDDEQHITHFVLEHGHLWGKRDVTIPIGAVDRVDAEAVVLALTKDEVGGARRGPREPLAIAHRLTRGRERTGPRERRSRRRRGRCSRCCALTAAVGPGRLARVVGIPRADPPDPDGRLRRPARSGSATTTARRCGGRCRSSPSPGSWSRSRSSACPAPAATTPRRG